VSEQGSFPPPICTAARKHQKAAGGTPRHYLPEYLSHRVRTRLERHSARNPTDCCRNAIEQRGVYVPEFQSETYLATSRFQESRVDSRCLLLHQIKHERYFPLSGVDFAMVGDSLAGDDLVFLPR
jgi:hypothetical protein